MTPWDHYWDTLQTLQLAERTGDADGIAQAKREAEDARRDCSLIGGILFFCSLDNPEVELRLGKIMAERVGEIATLASQEAVAAHATAHVLLFELEALKDRMRELERRLVKYECAEPQILKVFDVGT